MENRPGRLRRRERTGGVMRTKWDSPDIWLRRTFEAKALTKTGKLALIIHHDDDAEVYLNGTLIKASKRHTNNYQLALLDDKARAIIEVRKQYASRALSPYRWRPIHRRWAGRDCRPVMRMLTRYRVKACHPG